MVRQRDGNAEIYVRLVDGARLREKAGAVTPESVGGSVEYRLTDSAADSYEASIDALADGFAVAWYEKPSGPGRGMHDAAARAEIMLTAVR